MDATRCYLVRHCDVENPGRVLYGHLPGFGLSARGVAQAHRLGRALRGTPVGVIVTSPLQRARETAGIVAEHLPGVPVEVAADLREAEFGRYLQGVRYREIAWRRPGWWVHMAWPGLLPFDEPMSVMAARVRRQLERVLAAHREGGGVLVSHGDPIQAYWATSDGRPPWALHRLQCAKGGYLTLDFDGTRLLAKAYHSPDLLERGEAERPTALGGIA
ncbi:MAG TPA: histidine phosphatase family protein [Candidatus Micrarchaeia archaeon]|nr:histidine phosphatase family protein [Candidatus Micrarchaeia archaeon]